MPEEYMHEHIYVLSCLVIREFVKMPDADQINIISRAASLICDKRFKRSYANQLINMMTPLVTLDALHPVVRGMITDYLESWQSELVLFGGESA